MMGWQWHQLDHMPRSRQITMPVIHHLVFTGRMPFLPPNQQRQSIEGSINYIKMSLLCLATTLTHEPILIILGEMSLRKEAIKR